MTASQTTMKETIEIEPSKTGLVSIIVPCFGQLEYTRICVPRLLRFSRSPFELIFIDGGVLDGTSEYLAGVTALPSARVEIVEAPAEAGLPAACAVGLKHAQGEYVVFMSNETVVGERWLNHLVAAAKVAPEIGMVGTMSNLCPPPQWVGKLPYRIGLKKTAIGSSGPGSFPLDLEAVDQFASDWCEKHRGQSFEVERLGGSCLLIKAEVFKKIDQGVSPRWVFLKTSALISRQEPPKRSTAKGWPRCL